MSRLTTHVLDAATGTPAAGIAVELAGPRSLPIDAGVTDADGRATLGPEQLPAGEYTLAFRTGAYFAERDIPTFYPFITVTFTVEIAPDGSQRHLHVPLLLSPFAYSTYRGS
nr:hydroxyisourate hydrolase [Microbacterium lemovicicum]